MVTSGLESSTSYTKFKTYLFPQDEASTNLMMQARSFIKNLGSSYIGDVGWRDMWALVMQRIRGRNRLYAEGFQKSPSYQDWALPVSIHTNVPIRTEKTVDCHSEENEESARRKTFCAKFDGYEGVCDCEYWHAQNSSAKLLSLFFLITCSYHVKIFPSYKCFEIYSFGRIKGVRQTLVQQLRSF